MDTTSDSSASQEPCGIRVMRLLDTRLKEIVRREHTDDGGFLLYTIGSYWVSFEKSAYLLCRLFSTQSVSVVTHPGYPFPVVMASIPDCVLREYLRKHILRHDSGDYIRLDAPEIVPAHYRSWHRKEVRQFL